MGVRRRLLYASVGSGLKGWVQHVALIQALSSPGDPDVEGGWFVWAGGGGGYS